ncbi:MAG TPA: aminomethyl-transferring glycine dehydrogenase subunit GcvPB [Syntrophales bacterium]|jgi:glycine dehydrogenase subunit 2|nr:aminomethyl-transferring glycine dehydrogenase subunit GcvPB [Syntrophales bacterium]HQI36806.1 aminomethyl-transferring glycine dehydrogenase subunit GcvPB [Syntrophales bacterium]HRR48228.1 aminomethyl-transferring glycine dehydrogenase subunit GcvPB [Syntrophales bacterium]
MDLIFEKSRPGRQACAVPAGDVPAVDLAAVIPAELLREDLPLPEVAEVDLIRHYTALSRRNFGVDVGFYPLGSCTMKYNPKINEDIAKLPGFTDLHPYAPASFAQGSLQLMYELRQYLSEIFGMADFTLQPAAGAHGELTGIMIFKKYFEKTEEKRTKILIPDAAHGTNPASGALCGYQTVTVRSNAEGGVDIEQLASLMQTDVAGLMLTNPNTLGLFERNIEKVAGIIHEKGGLLYGDGANANAFLGKARPGDLGFDVIQLNLHKTFSTPHGCGGPGSGPVGVGEKLVDFLPIPRVVRTEAGFAWSYDHPDAIGRVRTFFGNFNVMVKAYAYIRALGPAGLKRVAEIAVLNANYIQARLKPYFDLPYERPCMHECVFSGTRQVRESGVHTSDIAKRLLDYGYHPPTIYFPLIAPEAIMIEPNETESMETLDAFCDAMIRIAAEAKDTPELVKAAPLTTPVRRLDEVRAAREPDVCWKG